MFVGWWRGGQMNNAGQWCCGVQLLIFYQMNNAGQWCCGVQLFDFLQIIIIFFFIHHIMHDVLL